MHTKKTSSKDLETKRFLFFQIGIVLTLAMVLWAFGYRETERVLVDLPRLAEFDPETEYIEITRPEPPAPPPPADVPELILAPDEDITVELDFVVDVDAHAHTMVEDFSPIQLSRPEVPEEEGILPRSEIMPEFPGGTQALYEYFGRVVQYPRTARQTGIQGTVFVGFVVEKDGTISNVHLIRGIGGGCDEEALNAIRNMPPWEPGRMGIHRVRVRYSLPIVFSLDR